MPKNIEDIIVPERRRSIRDIPIPESRRSSHIHAPLNIIREKPAEPPRSRKKLWIATALALLLLIFASLSLFNAATISYVPKSETLTFTNDIYTAKKTGDDGLLYSVIKLSGDKGQDVSASGENNVERKASGSIIVYNASAKEQKFRATTRFATPDGKTYQVKDAIAIPAKKMVGGVEKIGTREVVVYAEFPGNEYNIGLTDFTLPGLKGTSLSSLVYARSKTEMTGGFKGVEKIVDKAEVEKAKVALETALKEELISEARAQVPEDFILLPSLSSITFGDLPQSESGTSGSARINIRGKFDGVIVKRTDLSTGLASKKIKLTPGEVVDIAELNSLEINFADPSLNDLVTLNEIKFFVKGEAKAIWRTDEVALKADLLGKNKRDLNSILRNYPTVVSATTTIRPFWKSSFPSDGAKILIKKLPIN